MLLMISIGNSYLTIACDLLQVPGYPDFFNIVHDGDPSVYVYKLLEDYKEGDLCVLVQ